MRQRATRMGGNRAPAALAVRVAALMASYSGPKLWLDLSDVSTLQQDSAGTTPVTTAGDPIGRIMDKSGAANHATQATTTSRPLWQTTFAALDGVDDSWATASIDFTSTDKVTVISGVRKLSDAARAIIVEGSTSFGVIGSFGLAGPWTAAAPDFLAGATGLSAAAVTAQPSGFAAPISAVATAIYDLAGATPATRVIARINGVSTGAASGATGGGTFGNIPLNIGRRAGSTLPFNGNLYGLIIIGRLLSPDELWVCERYMAQQPEISI